MVLFVYITMLFIASCREPETVPEPTPYNLTIPAYFPTRLNIPSDNPLTVEGIALDDSCFTTEGFRAGLILTA
jgi:hypothetical protein